LRCELADQLTTYPRAPAGQHRELADERVHGHDRYLLCHCLSTIQGACRSTTRSYRFARLTRSAAGVVLPLLPKATAGWNHLGPVRTALLQTRPTLRARRVRSARR